MAVNLKLEGLLVKTKTIGKTPRKVLFRSDAMETMMRNELTKVVEKHKNSAAQYDGIIYIMHTRSPDGCVVPRYIGKAETVGKTSGIRSHPIELFGVFADRTR